jgi:hypothetical protein
MSAVAHVRLVIRHSPPLGVGSVESLPRLFAGSATWTPIATARDKNVLRNENRIKVVTMSLVQIERLISP